MAAAHGPFSRAILAGHPIAISISSDGTNSDLPNSSNINRTLSNIHRTLSNKEKSSNIEINRTYQDIFVKFDSCSIRFGNRRAIVRFCSIKFDGLITNKVRLTSPGFLFQKVKHKLKLVIIIKDYLDITIFNSNSNLYCCRNVVFS